MGTIAVVIAAGGVGARLGRRTPKQFLTVGEEPVLLRTVRHFTRHPAVGTVVVTAPASHVARTRRLVARLATHAAVRVVAGGATRQASVRRALAAVPDDADLVIVHDGVRPFINRTLVDSVVAAAREAGAAVCALPMAETVKRVRDGLVEATLDRAALWAVQTPQAFRLALLRQAHEQARRAGVVATDDAMLVERLGHPVRVVRGSELNVKITTPGDLRRARSWTRR